MLSLTKPADIELSVVIREGGCGWPIEIRRRLNPTQIFAFSNTPFVSAYAAEDTTL